MARSSSRLEEDTHVGAQGIGIRPILLDRDGAQTDRWDETIQSLTELPELLNSERQRK